MTDYFPTSSNWSRHQDIHCRPISCWSLSKVHVLCLPFKISVTTANAFEMEWLIILLTVGKTLEECREDMLGHVRHWSEKYVSSYYIQSTQIDIIAFWTSHKLYKFQQIKKCTLADLCTLYWLCTSNHSCIFVTGGLLTTSHMHYKICLVYIRNVW